MHCIVNNSAYGNPFPISKFVKYTVNSLNISTVKSFDEYTMYSIISLYIFNANISIKVLNIFQLSYTVNLLHIL